jgi:hypothetical protein
MIKEYEHLQKLKPVSWRSPPLYIKIYVKYTKVKSITKEKGLETFKNNYFAFSKLLF